MIETEINGVALSLATAPDLFSPRRVDPGTLAMLSCVRFQPDDKILDLGCGYGVIGIVAARLIDPRHVFMVDSDPLAVRIAQDNIARNSVDGVTVVVSDAFDALSERDFSKILCNPPYHSDFSIAKRFIEKGFNRLIVGGAMWLVTRRETWYRNKLTGIFGGVRVHKIDEYLVFEAEKRRHSYRKVEKGR